jgi:fumarate hydratase class II
MEVVRALARVKKAAARVNRELGGLDAERAGWIEAAADEVIRGDLDDHFPLSVWQSGSGTQTNMNVNEVIANRASELGGGERGRKEPVHPNDHVNRSQSTNDAFPTAMHLAGATALEERLLPAVEALRDTFAGKQREFARVLKIGRTHLQDAVPLTLGQEIGGWRAQLDADLERLRAARDGLLPLALGGTAVGTGLGAPARFGERCAALLAEWTGLPFRSDPEKFAAIAAHDAVVAASGALRVLAASLIKIANDVRLAGSGPRAARERARLVDHAGQGEPDPVRVAGDGRDPGARQRRGRRPGGRAGPLRAQRDEAAPRPRLPALGASPGGRLRELPRILRGGDRARSCAAGRGRRALAHAGDSALPRRGLRPRRGDRAKGAPRGHDPA